MSISSEEVKEQSKPLLSPTKVNKRESFHCCQCTLKVWQNKGSHLDYQQLWFFFVGKAWVLCVRLE